MTKVATRKERADDDPYKNVKQWPDVPLGEHITSAKAGFACGERSDAGVIQLRMNNVDTQGRFLWNQFIRVPADAKTISEYALRPGDVLFNNTNSTELVGKSALFNGHDNPIVYSNHFTRLRVKADTLCPAYLASWLNHTWQRGTFAEICNRWIGQSAVKADKLLALVIPLPPLAEQERIARRLAEQLAVVEQARAAARERLAAAEALPAAYLREAFEGPEADGWERLMLSEICDFKNGLNFKTGESGHSLKIIGVGDFQKHLHAPVETLKEVYLDEPLADDYLVQADDILFVRSNGNPDLVGRSMIIPTQSERITFTGFSIRARVRGARALAIFIAYYFKSPCFAAAIKEVGQGANIRNISQEFLSKLAVPLPPCLSDQQRIAVDLSHRLAEAERLAAGVRNELAAIDALPAALLREAFHQYDQPPGV